MSGKPFSPDKDSGKVYWEHMNFTCDVFVSVYFHCLLGTISGMNLNLAGINSNDGD